MPIKWKHPRCSNVDAAKPNSQKYQGFVIFFKSLKGPISTSAVAADVDNQRTRKCAEIALWTQLTLGAGGRSGRDRGRSGRVMTVSDGFGLSIHSGWRRKLAFVDCAFTSPRLKQCSAARTSARGKEWSPKAETRWRDRCCISWWLDFTTRRAVR